MKQFTGKVTIAGQEYDCEVKDGIRYIDGKTVDVFMQSLTVSNLCNLAIVGASTDTAVSPAMVLKCVEQNEKN